MLGGYGGPVGLDNYARLFNDKMFLRSVANTFYFVLLTTPAFVALGLFLALALTTLIRRSAILRSIFFGSSVLSVTIVTLIWRLVYMPERGSPRQRRAGARRRSAELHDQRGPGDAGDRDRHRVVDHRAADDAVPRRPAADPTRDLRGGRTRQRLALADADRTSPCPRSGAPWCWSP